MLKKGTPIERITFNAVTKPAVLAALENPREIDQPLVEAYLARRALDYLVGFTLSPVLWRKLPGSRSAGRVQSVALRLICDRELEIEAFKTTEYWSIEALLKSAAGDEVRTRVVAIDGATLKRHEIGTDEMGQWYQASHSRWSVLRCQRRQEGCPPQPIRAVHHVDAAAGSQPQTGFFGEADNECRPAPL